MLKAIEIISTYPDNWNGEGTKAAILYSVKNAKKFAETFLEVSQGNMPKPTFSIENKGTLMCFWALENRTYIDLSFDSENAFSLFKRTKDGVETYLECVEMNKLNLEWFKELLK